MIEPVSGDNLVEVLPLIRKYQEFYEVSPISDDKNKRFFSQFGKRNPGGCQFLYRDKGKAVGFATVYFSYASSIAEKIAVLNDLYTLEECRGKGIGRALIEHCRSYARESGAARLQWVTAPDNEQAQRLYDSLDTKKSTWAFYVYKT